MTLEEAKKILEKEFAVISLHKSTEPFEFDESGWIEHEKPSVLEAFRVLAKGGYYISISGHDYNMREKRLKKEYEENTKAPGSSENRIKEDSGVNPALKESASQFNDALLDEQAKKIKRLTKKITRLNKIIHKKNMKIEEFRKESSRHLRGKIKIFGGNLDLSQELCDKNEELRLSKIREKNLTEVCQKYMKEVEELNEKAKSVNMHRHKELAEKDEVIADLGKELAATKKELEGTNNLVRMVRNASKEYCEYGIAAEKMIQKLSKIIVSKGLVPSDVFEKCRLWANGYRYNPQLSDFIEEEEKKLTAKTLDFNAKCMKAARESINDVFESYAAKYAKSSLDDLKEKAYESFNAKAHKLGLVGSKDGNGLLNQMAGVDAAEEGADQSGKIVICGKDFGKLLKENEESAEELSKVLNDVIDQFLLFGEIIIKEEK